MSQHVGGETLGACTPSGGLVTVSAATYDLPWLVLLLNTYVKEVMLGADPTTNLRVDADIPDTFTAWQLNFSRNESDQISSSCFYDPHWDKNNAQGGHSRWVVGMQFTRERLRVGLRVDAASLKAFREGLFFGAFLDSRRTSVDL